MRFVIIGNGVAGITAALTLRARERNADITVISGETDYFFSRTALMYAFMDRLERRDLEPYERQVWNQQRIQLVRGWVIGLDGTRRAVKLDTGAEITYDKLLLATGSRPNVAPWKGLDTVQHGLVHFVSMQDLDRCEQYTKANARAVVVGGGLIGVELVECLHHHGMQVTFLVREPSYWPAALHAEEGRMVSDHIARHGIQVLHNELVEEVVANASGSVKAIRTANQTFECDLLGVAIGVHPAIEWLRKTQTPPETKRGILVGPDFRTSLANVWSAGDCAEFVRPGEPSFVEQIWYSAKRHGELAALSMLGDKVDYRPPIFYNSSKFFEIEYTTVGAVTNAPAGARHFFAKHPNKEISVRIVESDGAVIGFNMLGSRWQHNFFERWIAERRSLDYCLAHLNEAQFDVEFGRVDLGFLKAVRA
jgi:NADPH-dependent 2,4-dienoyl-CoA reductase/sulfur reductase-like enzyme